MRHYDNDGLLTFQGYEELSAFDKKYYNYDRWKLICLQKCMYSYLGKPEKVLETDLYKLRVFEKSGLICDDSTFTDSIQIDVTKAPWPILDEEFGLCILEKYLLKNRPKAKTIIKEARRVSKNGLLILPYKWPKTDDYKLYYGIDEEVARNWTDGLSPTLAIKYKPESGNWKESYILLLYQNWGTGEKKENQEIPLFKFQDNEPLYDSVENGCLEIQTFNGIGDNLMLLGVIRRFHLLFPNVKIKVNIPDNGMKDWFVEACPDIEFINKKCKKLVWSHEPTIPGYHAVTRYGADVEDIHIPNIIIPKRNGKPRIAFVTETGAPHLYRKEWPYWEKLEKLIKDEYGVEPFWIGTKTKVDNLSDLPNLLASMDCVVTIEGMASHMCWAIRKRAIVICSGAINPQTLSYPGFHTIIEGECRYDEKCHAYMYPGRVLPKPECNVECMSTISAETIFLNVKKHLSREKELPRIINVHFMSPKPHKDWKQNSGDMNCGVARYLPEIEERSNERNPVKCDVAIFGGGGLYQPYAYELAKKYKNLGAKIVVWGAGIVTEDREKGMTPWNWREFGDMADLCGLREDNPWNFVPCPSCLSPFFDTMRNIIPEHEEVFYNHPDKPVRDGNPRMTNYQTTDLKKIFKFLSSGKKVVTSSYHGRVWSTWLGREIELDGLAAKQLSQSGTIPSLEESRKINLEFWEKVKKLAITPE